MFIARTTGNHFTFLKKKSEFYMYLIYLHAYTNFYFLCSVMYMKSRSRSKKYAITSKEIYIKFTENTKGY